MFLVINNLKTLGVFVDKLKTMDLFIQGMLERSIARKKKYEEVKDELLLIAQLLSIVMNLKPNDKEKQSVLSNVNTMPKQDTACHSKNHLPYLTFNNINNNLKIPIEIQCVLQRGKIGETLLNKLLSNAGQIAKKVQSSLKIANTLLEQGTGSNSENLSYPTLNNLKIVIGKQNMLENAIRRREKLSDELLSNAEQIVKKIHNSLKNVNTSLKQGTDSNLEDLSYPSTSSKKKTEDDMMMNATASPANHFNSANSESTITTLKKIFSKVQNQLIDLDYHQNLYFLFTSDISLCLAPYQ